MNSFMRLFALGGWPLAAFAALGTVDGLASAQPPAVDLATAPPAPTPRVGNDIPLWLRPPDDVLPRPESEGESRGAEARADEIETDRDSFTPAISTAGRGRLIAESAYSFLDNRHVAETHSFPEFLVRYGVTDRLELRLGWNYEVGGSGNDASGSLGGGAPEEGGLKRDSKINYGLKVAVTEQHGWFPASIIILEGFTPTSGAESATELVATSGWGWELPNRWKFDAAIRYGTGSEAGDRFDIYAPSCVLKVPIGEKWAVHAEYFGLFSANKDHDSVVQYFSPGVHYLVTSNLEVGVRVGWGLNDQSAKFFSNAGIGWRF